MARQSSSSRWSRPATGKQIAALKSQGNYDGKYFSMGRASQTIGRSIAGGSPAGNPSNSGGREGRTTHSGSTASSAEASLLAQLLGVPNDLESLISLALGQSSPSSPAHRDDAVESVIYTIAPDESNSTGPRIVFEAAVVRDSRFAGAPSIQVRFASNVDFGEAPPHPASGFVSGVKFVE